MKTGVVMEIRNDVAVILQPNGVFIEQAPRPDWEVGSVVGIDAQHKPRAMWIKRLAVVAACFVLLLAAGLVGYTFLFQTSSVISIDINPSVELKLNRMGRVVDMSALNDDGSILLSGLELKGKPYSEAIPILLQSEAMQPYLANNLVLEFAVYSQNDAQDILDYLNVQGQVAAATYPQLRVHCNGVGSEVVQQAHEHGISPGKMQALLDLQQLDPSIDVDTYSHHSMAEIRRLIREHHGGTGQGGGSGSQGGSNGSQGEGNGHGNGGHGKHAGNALS